MHFCERRKQEIHFLDTNLVLDSVNIYEWRELITTMFEIRSKVFYENY